MGNLSKKIGSFCREYRTVKELRLRDITDEGNIKTLSAFENGKSTNLNHLVIYFKLALSNGDADDFMTGIMDIIKDGKECKD